MIYDPETETSIGVVAVKKQVRLIAVTEEGAVQVHLDLASAKGLLAELHAAIVQVEFPPITGYLDAAMQKAFNEAMAEPMCPRCYGRRFVLTEGSENAGIVDCPDCRPAGKGESAGEDKS